MDEHSISLLEFDRVAGAVAERARSEAARRRLAAWRPIDDAPRRREECALLRESLARSSEPGEWTAVGDGDLLEWLDEPEGASFDALVLLGIASWLDAARATRSAWSGPEAMERHPGLGSLAAALPDLESLRTTLHGAIEPDGRIADSASPVLRRARQELSQGERRLEERLERWARGFGEGAYVTRRADRFVALVPAAGFQRSRDIVHDVSGSGQSLFVEPLDACDANNRLMELKVHVREEEARVLRELSDRVHADRDRLHAIESTLVHFDTLIARVRWARDVGGVAVTPGGSRLRLRQAVHPLLAMGERRDALVPLDLDLGGDARLLLVSGPNMGGKTVLLKTVGLAVVLSHAAFPVPAGEASEVPEYDDVRVDLGDEQSVDQGLSTFAGHLRSLAAMAEHASPRTMLLADELGSGTDPDEGAALGRALVEHFVSRGAWGVVTTHLGQLKRVAGEVSGVQNGSLEYDAEAMQPRFRFLAGVPGASHGLEVAQRLEFPGDVLARARALTPATTHAIEGLLQELQDTGRRLHDEADRMQAARQDAEAAEADHRAAAEDARRSLAGLRGRLTAESEAVLAQARELWQTMRREARRAEKSRARAEDLGQHMADVEKRVDALQREAADASGESHLLEPLDVAKVAPGLRVRVGDLGGVVAEVESVPDGDGRVALRRGNWSIRSHVSKLFPAEAAGANGERANSGPTAEWSLPDEAAPHEVHLRGMDVEEAIRTLDGGLDRAVLAGLTELRVIHGLGKGVLRAAVERHLRAHPQVASQRMGDLHEGGRGVTVAQLR